MSKIVRVSRQGLSRCPSCQTHVDVSADLDSARCPACGEELVVARQNDGGTFGRMVTRLLSSSTAGALGAVLGISMTTACALEEPDEPTDLEDVIPEATILEVTSPDAVEPVPAPETPSARIYGGPGMPKNVEERSIPADVPQATIYGGPGMMGGGPLSELEEPPKPPPPRRTTLKLEGPIAAGDFVDLVTKRKGKRKVVAGQVVVMAVRPGEIDVMLEAEARRLADEGELSAERHVVASPPLMAPVYGGPPGPDRPKTK